MKIQIKYHIFKELKSRLLCNCESYLKADRRRVCADTLDQTPHKLDCYFPTVASICLWLVASVDTMISQAVDNSPRPQSLRSYATSNCLCSQGALWHWRHRKIDPRAVCPCASSDQSEANQGCGPPAEPVPRDDPSVWQTEHKTGEAGHELTWEGAKQHTFSKYC